MKSWIKSFVIMLVSLFLVLGCQDVADELVGKKPEGARTINITMIAKSSDNPVFLSAKIGAETAAKDLSEKYSMLDVNILWSTPLTENAEEQAEIISNAVKVGTDAIKRFTRPICYQDWPNELLPDELKNDNPLNIWRQIDNKFTQANI